MDTGRRKTLHIGRIAMLTMFSIAFFSIWMGYHVLSEEDYGRTYDESKTRIERLAQTAALHAERTIAGGDALARQMVLGYLEKGEKLDLFTWNRAGLVDPDFYPQIGIINSNGIYVKGSVAQFEKVDLNDRPHFVFHKNGNADVLFVGRVVRGRVSGKLSIQLTRRIDRPGKGFEGVAVVSFSPQYFVEFYKDIVSPGRSMYLIGDDGYSRTEYTGEKLEVDRNLLQEKWYQLMSKEQQKVGVVAVDGADGQREFYAYHEVPNLPLTVVINASNDEMFSAYNRANRSRMLGALSLTLILLILLLIIERNNRMSLRNEAALKKQAKDLSEAIEVKEKFVRNISHELRTPLAGIAAGGDYIYQFSTEKDMQETAQGILTATAHLKDIVDNLLMLSANVDLSNQLVLEEVSLLNVINASVLMNQREADRKHLTLQIKSPEGGDSAMVFSNKTALLQILQNLISNALKFTEKGGIVVEVQRTGGFFKVSVEDEGIGINAADIPKLFKQFAQLEQFGARPMSGTGLGLYLSAQLVQALGGEIGVESTLGQGSKFFFTVPIVRNNK